MKDNFLKDNDATVNQVTARIEFFFKGEKFTPSAQLNIDKLLQTTDKLPVIHDFLAKENGIDCYSYEYEVMLLENIKYEDPQGIISNFIDNGELDIQAFESKWKELKIWNSLQKIAQNHLNIEVLEQQHGLKEALLEAYQLGHNSR